MVEYPAAACYRLYIGEATPAGVLAVLNAHNLNATVYAPASGLWNRTIEPCVIAEVIRDLPNDDLIQGVARDLARTFDQNCVLVTRSDIAFSALVGQSG